MLGTRDEPPRVAFAVGRAVGPAVTRNRVRRRLRAIVRDASAQLEPGCGYLWRALPPAADASAAELRACVAAVLIDRGSLS